MNPLHATQLSRFRSGQSRDGLSIIEVLTSIVVAMIGVFGVMILIPFAVKQAQTGLDSDAAVMVGRNAYSQFEVYGYRNPENWAVYRGTNVPRITGYSPYEPTDLDNDGTIDGPDGPEIFSIDPLGILENGALTAVPAPPDPLLTAYVQGVFPFNQADVNGSTNYPGNLFIAPANLGTPTGAVMGQAVARRMFRSAEDLVFADATDELLGPEQVFDQGGAGFARRQSIGRISWSVIVVPFKDDPLLSPTTHWSYKMYILVYKDRQTLLPNVEGQMLTVMLEPTQNIGLHTPVSTVHLEPGVFVEPAVGVDGGINRDDWVMLINRGLNYTDDVPPPGVVYLEKGFDRQIAFYRVVNVSDGAAVQVATNPATLSTLTLDGPDFSFGDPAGVNASIDPDGIARETFIVHLKDVVAVYERTFDPENESNWTF